MRYFIFSSILLYWEMNFYIATHIPKVDFFWINRDQKSFEWFLQLLNQMEAEQEEEALGHHKFLDMHIYLTAALQRTDMRAVALQTAIDILHKKVSTYIYF